MKKGAISKIGLATVITSLFSISLAFAQTNFEVLGETFAEKTSNFFGSLYLDPKNSSSILMGILLFMIIYSVLKNVRMFQSYEDDTANYFWSGGIALIVTLLAMIYLPSNFIEMIGPQFGAMGGTMLTMIPLIIMFYFTVWTVNSLVIARLSWLIYTIYYFIIFISLIATAPNWSFNFFDFKGNPAAPYFWGIILGVIMFSFIYYFRKKFYREILRSQKEAGIRRIKKAKAGADILASAADEFSHGGRI